MATVKYPDAVRADMAEVERLVRDLKGIRQRLKPAMRKATADSAKRIQMDARKKFRAQTRGIYTRHYPNSISYSIGVSNASKVTAEIGPEKSRAGGQGSLGHLFELGKLEWGSVKNPPIPHLIPAFNAEVDNYADKLDKRAADAIIP